MPLYWRNKVLLAKIEATYGTDSTPVGTTDAILATDFTIMPMEGEDVSRDLDTNFIGGQPTIPAGLFRKIRFKVELEPSGTAGTAPAWGVLMRGCGISQTVVAVTSVTYAPVALPVDSLTIWFQVGLTRYRFAGARGTVVMRFSASGIPYLEFEFTGLYITPAEATSITPTLTGFRTPRVVSRANTPTFTLNAVSVPMRSFALDVGNQVEPRFLVNLEEIIITDRKDMVETTIEAVPLTTLNPFALAEASTGVAASLVHGTGAGRIATLSIPTLQLMRPAGLEQQQGVVEWPLRGVALGTTGANQWTLALT
jgi:hypothetical protein